MKVCDVFGASVASFLFVGAAAGARAGEDTARETLPAGIQIAALEVHPPRIELRGRIDYSQILLSGRTEAGEQVDLTRLAEVRPAAGLVEVSPRGIVRPLKDGSGEIRLEFLGRSVSIPVAVAGYEAPFHPSFIRDVEPVISRVGCNAGTCHGSAQGKNGFKLSLRGNDPVLDHIALTDDLAGRRFNRAAPDQSLFLMKISGTVPHEGGVVARTGEPYYEILRTWVAQGVKLDGDVTRAAKIEVLPRNFVIPLPGMKQQMAVLATYADGTVRDVTQEAFIETSSSEITGVERGGVVTALRRGEAAILARYEGNYAATQLFVMGDRAGFAWTDAPVYNHVDALVYKKLKTLKTLPSDVATDAEFLRRASLDLAGLQPSPKQVRAFLLDGRDSRKKREEMVDRLIGSTEFIEHWTNKWADLLQVNPKFLGEPGTEATTRWIRQAVASNMPYDKFVQSVLNSSGSTLQNPAAAYFKVLRQPDLVMENTTQLFLGVRFNCNKCHDHPFERWTQHNHWEMAAYFAQVGRTNAPNSPIMPVNAENQLDGQPPAFDEIISDLDKGEVTAPYSGKTVAPAFPFRLVTGSPPKGSRREALTAWITSRDNPYFARSYVNRIWSYFLGIGLIDPVDDIRAGNPPSNPELLDRLTHDFIESGFDVRKLMRTIVTSRVYQHSYVANRWNEDDTSNFSRALARRLPAETLFDVIHQTTGSVPRLPGKRFGTRAAELHRPAMDVGDGFLALFGRPPRESACECERASGMSLGHALNLVNGPTVAGAIRDPQNAIADLVSVEHDPGRIVEELFVSILCRMPTDEERKKFERTVQVSDPANADSLNQEEAKLLADRFASWEKSQNIVEWKPLDFEIRRSAGGATLSALGDGSILASGVSPDKDSYTLAAYTDLKGITGFRVEALADNSLPKKGPGRSGSGNFVLSELSVAQAPVKEPAATKPLALQNASATFAQDGYPAGNAIDGKPDTGWAIAPAMGKNHKAYFESKEDGGPDGGTILTFTLDQNLGGQHTFGRLRIMATTSKRPVRGSELPQPIIDVLLTEAAKRTPQQKADLYRHFIAQDPEIAQKLRLSTAQDLAWALINSPAFLFNR